MVQALIASGKVELNGSATLVRVPLVEAAHNGHIGCLTALLAAPGISVNATTHWGDEDDEVEHTALTAAAAGGHATCLRALLAADGIDTAKFDLGSKAAIHWAAEGGHLECLRALLGADGVDADQEDDCRPTETARSTPAGVDTRRASARSLRRKGSTSIARTWMGIPRSP